MKTLIPRLTLPSLVLALVATVVPNYAARAVPYASCITNNAGTVSYYLNEAATDVKIIFDGGGAGNTNAPGAQTKGIHSFALGAHTSYKIQVTQVAATGWVLTSDDSNPLDLYGSPRGVAVSQVSSNLSTFGRIYVSDSATPGAAATRIQDAATHNWRTNNGKGVYILNADQSDCVGQASICNGTNTCVNAFSNGMALLTPFSTSSPYKLGFGPDNKLYVNAFGTVDATTWRSTNADCTGFELVLSGVGENVNPTVHTDFATKPVVRGSTDDSSLKLWCLDGAYSGHLNGIAEWDILGGPLPWNTPPTFIGTATAYSSVADVGCDLDMGPDGKWFILVNRSAGTDRSSIQEYDTDGATLLWDSFTQYGITAGNTANPDPLRNAQACALSPDGKTYSFIRTDNSIMMFTLTNGVIDQSTLFTFTQPSSASVTAPATGNGRQLCYDAAGNIYTVSSGQARLRVFAPGGFTVATTGSDGSFVLTKPTTTASVTATTAVTSMDSTQPPGVFTLTRVGNTAANLPVGYTLTGTATNGVQYQLLSGTVIFKAGDASTNINVVAIPYSPAGPTRSVILTINSSNTYAPASPLTATVLIIDTNKPSLLIARKDAQMYERTNDLARFTITRYGDTNVDLPSVNITYGGTAANGTDFIGTTPFDVPLGAVTQNFSITPIHNGIVTGPLTVTATVAAAGDGSYTLGSPSTSEAITIVDSDYGPETILWSDDFSTDTSANWTYLFATTNTAPTDDFRINQLSQGVGTWPFDYSGLGIPSAPNTRDGSTMGLYMTANKDDSIAVAAALNFYPNGKSFSGNFALRFDMFLIENDTTSTTEYALFGINHSGTKTNWFRNTTAGFNGVDATTWSYDGIFYDVESDGAALGDYVGYSAPTTANVGPTPITPGVNASSLTGIFKSPPWTPGAGGGGAAANIYGSATPIWADVEISQINNVITWKINRTVIFAYTNTTGFTSGNIMLGYEDGFDSIGSTGGAVIYDNVRVISLAVPTITKIQVVGANAQINFTANASDVPSQFVLQSAALVTGPYVDVSSTITSLGGGNFLATRALSGPTQFYRVRRVF